VQLQRKHNERRDADVKQTERASSSRCLLCIYRRLGQRSQVAYNNSNNNNNIYRELLRAKLIFDDDDDDNDEYIS